MESLPLEIHPATQYNVIRHHVFAVFERLHDIDRALAVVSQYEMPKHLFRKWYAGLKAELIVYEEERDRLSLSPGLDAGVKADFSGIRNGAAVYIDVTTNLDYKSLNDYYDVIRRGNRRYEIALVDTNRESIEFIPLRFPLCPICGQFAHYVLMMDRPESGAYFFASESQDLVRCCVYCGTMVPVSNFDYLVDSPLYSLTTALEDEETLPQNFDQTTFLQSESVPVVTFFEKVSGLMLSGLTDEETIFDPRNDEEEIAAKLIWKHPLAEEFLDDYLEYELT